MADIVKRRSYNRLRIGAGFWKDIKNFVTENYTEYFVKIITDEVVITHDMDDAYENLCQYSDSIKQIDISANTADEKLDIEIANGEKRLFKHTMKLYAECLNDAKADEVRNFADQIKYGQFFENFILQLSVQLTLSAIVTIIILTLNALFSSLAIILIIYYLSGLIILAAAIYGLRAIDTSINGRKRILFLTTYENIAEHRKRRIRGYIYVSLIYLLDISLYIFIFNFFIEWIVSITI